MKGIKNIILLSLVALMLPAQLAGEELNNNLTIARLKYRGGGDWYNDASAIPNLMKEISKRTGIPVNVQQKVVSLTDDDLFSYPFLFLTGHGNIKFTDEEAERLRHFLTSGGFLYADDDYGMDESFRREIKKVFPESELVELPDDHPIYHCYYQFPRGLPKIHEHFEGPPRGFGIFHEGRMVVYYTYNSNISDGWPDEQVHNDPPDIREKAFKMGINIVFYSLLF